MATNGSKRMALGSVTQGKARGKALAAELAAALTNPPKMPESKTTYGKHSK